MALTAHVTSLTVLPLLSCSSATLPHPKRRPKLLTGNQFLPWHTWFPARYYRKIASMFSQLSLHSSDLTETAQTRKAEQRISRSLNGCTDYLQMPPKPQFFSCLFLICSRSSTPSPTCGVLFFGAMVVSYAVCTVTISSPSPSHLLPQWHTEKGSLGFFIHNILIWYFILSVKQDRWSERHHDTSHKQYNSITLLRKETCLSFSRVQLWGGDQTKPAILPGKGDTACSI